MIEVQRENAKGDKPCDLATRFTMPARLVMIRHGESEANLVNRAIRRGIISGFPEGFAKIPDREIRLSKNGRQQALDTASWLGAQYPDSFDMIYVSDHTRAKETAGLICQKLGWHSVPIRIDPLLGERNWGRFSHADDIRRSEILSNRGRDPLHNPMPDGETLLETRHRSRELTDRCSREFAGKRVLVFTHGEYIEASWAEIAHMNTERQIEFFASEAGDLKNCQVVEFSSIDPGTSEPNRGLRWVRSSCPRLDIVPHWKEIERIQYTAEELLFQVRRYPQLDFPEIEGLR